MLDIGNYADGLEICNKAMWEVCGCVASIVYGRQVVVRVWKGEKSGWKCGFCVQAEGDPYTSWGVEI